MDTTTPEIPTNLLNHKTKQPGRLRGKSTLVLETRHAQMIFEGRKSDLKKGKAEIVGLKKFASLLRSIWQAASNDDPYADWWLLKIEKSLEVASSDVDDQINKFKKMLSQEQNLLHEVSHSIEPIQLELRFSIPYAYQGAKLLMMHDELVRTLLTANHVGVLDNEAVQRALHHSGRRLRGVFQSVTGYRFTGLSRKEVLSANAKAIQAMSDMGAVPEKIMDKTLRAGFMPESLIFAKTGSGYFTQPDQSEKIKKQDDKTLDLDQ